jgi:hypothetical protein
MLISQAGAFEDSAARPFFEDIPLEVWDFQMGRYLVCVQWFKYCRTEP